MRINFKKIYIFHAWSIGFCLLPLFAMLAASLFATLNNCTLHEGHANPCVVMGIDWGGLLGTAFVSMWYFLLTGPIAALLFVTLLMTAAAHAIIRWRKAR